MPSDPALNSMATELAGIDLSNLYSVIDKNNVHGLNLDVPETAKELIKPWENREDDEKFVESNVDDQLMIHIPFTENVRIKSILLKVGRGDMAPRHLDIYLNQPNIVDFSDAETLQPHLKLALLEGETGVLEYPVRMTAFASVHSLSLFFTNPDHFCSRVYFVGFRGDMRSVKREGATKLLVPAPTAADAAIGSAKAETKASSRTMAR